MSEIENIEGAILHGLLYNEDFKCKTFPFIKDDYFQSKEYSEVFKHYSEYVGKYNNTPTPEAIMVTLQSSKNMSEQLLTDCSLIINNIKADKDNDIDEQWLSDITEKWCQDSAFYNVLVEAADVIDNDKNNVSKFGMPEKMSDALAISFDTSIGHDYFEDALSRYEGWHEKTSRVEFDIEMFNTITKGGQPPKTLSVLMSSKTGGFKSGTMCSFSAGNLMKGENVLYITNELAEEVVAERIDANLLGVDLDDLRLMSKSSYLQAVDRNKLKTKGKLVIKEYPTSSAHAGHFRFLLNELKQKHGFVPKMIYIDYLNICTSSRLPASAAANSYLYIKSIAEELRGLAVEFNLPIMTATQAGRQAVTAADLGMEDVSESYGLVATADMLIGVITSPELDEMNQIIFKQLKNRFGDVNKWNTFAVGVNKAQMRLYDLDKATLNKKVEKISTGGYKITKNDEANEESSNTRGFSTGSKSKKEKFNSFKF